MHILSFDFGTKKIGVAVGQTITKTSSPLKIIYNKSNKTDWDEIKLTIDEWKPNIILVGNPLNMDGSEGKIFRNVANFIKKLNKITKIECILIDERLTTFEAREKMKDLKKNDNLDDHAAAILIENWFTNYDNS